MEDMVIVEDLRKTYGKDIVAVDGVSFRFHKGEIFGFLGPNGVGKSTTIKILATLLAKSSGKATIDNLDIDADQAKVRRIIGYCSQEVGVDDDLTARENMMLQCSFHHIPKNKAKSKTEELLQKVRRARYLIEGWHFTANDLEIIVESIYVKDEIPRFFRNMQDDFAHKYLELKESISALPDAPEIPPDSETKEFKISLGNVSKNKTQGTLKLELNAKDKRHGTDDDETNEKSD